MFLEIKGVEEIDKYELEQFLQSQNVKRGVFIPSLDFNEIEHEILTNFSEVAWVSIESTGTRVVIEIVEKDLPKETESLPTNIVAKKRWCDNKNASFIRRTGGSRRRNCCQG